MVSIRPAILRIFTLVILGVADIYYLPSLALSYAIGRDTRLPPVYSFIKTELPPDAVILGDERVWLFTGRQALGMPAPTEYSYLDRLDSEIDFFMTYKDVENQFGAGYVLLEPWDGVRCYVPSHQAKQFAAAMTLRPGPGAKYSPKTVSSSFGFVLVALDRRSSFK